MALYFTYAIECYRREDALRICDHLLSVPLPVANHRVRVIAANLWLREGLWLLTAHPEGIGHSYYSRTDPELNSPNVVAGVIEQAYEAVARETGIRRALCGYEAQDGFEDAHGVPTPNDFTIPGLLFDASSLSSAQLPLGARRFGERYYRNPLARKDA
jgi:hypothetical protein